jgi:hypothetical protein
MTKLNEQPIPFPQEPLWKETLGILNQVKEVDLLKDSSELRKFLPFNSQETRKRCGAAISTRFGRIDPQVLSGLVALAQSSVDRSSIEDIWRVLFCQIEELFGKTFLDIIWPRDPGSTINRNELRSYVQTTFPQESDKLYQRLSACFLQANYLMPQKKENFIVVGFANLELPLLIATHLLIAREPRTIKISEIEANPYWKFLGYRKFDHVRVAFRNAEAKGTIMRYAVVDHLEQITTRYTWAELLNRLNGQP